MKVTDQDYTGLVKQIAKDILNQITQCSHERSINRPLYCRHCGSVMDAHIV